ncbi:MAG: phosphatidylserine/phosphatidylglycerophosphate/cardiolipin synthase family protein, partial [Rubrivivax sp.]|nr:phosphatidylserine/phosphatidylglycerophosphate/cardiolipin synthase family protein [Rubrivivax sp.]
LWIPGSCKPPQARPLAELVCVALGQRARAAVSAFLRDHGDPSQHVTVLLLDGPVPPDLAAAVEIAGIRAAVDYVAPQGLLSQQWLDERLRTRAPDLLVYARMPTALLFGARWPVPGLLLPPPAPVSRPLLQLELDAPDLVDEGTVLRARFEYASGIGRRTPIPDQPIAFVCGGQVVAVLTTHEGETELPAGLQAGSYGVFRTHAEGLSAPLARLEQHVLVIRPGQAPLVLFDAELEPAELAALRACAAQGGQELLAVRMRPMRSCRWIRARLQAAGIEGRVVDASLVLDEGDALDVPDTVDAVRLARVAARLRAAGFPAVAIVHRAAENPVAQACATLRAQDIGSTTALPSVAPPRRRMSLAERLETTTAAPLIGGNRIELELDNVRARRWLLEAIAAARQRVHLQVYMAADDDVGRQVEAALAQAAARGVRVRLLVDSLHGLHGSLGTRNPLLERLGAMPGIELRVSRPITTLPSLQDLKLRDHRKLFVVDNRLALLGGRNLSHEYFTGFDEVALNAQSLWREVPWLDAGARVQGPAVAALERSFLDAWTNEGGTAFEVEDVPAAGGTPVRVVIHRGLRDAATLEAYLAIIEAAQSHLHVVNGFPLVLEIQHALLRAVKRGVRVRTLFGHLTPSHGGEPFHGPWGTARAAATALVHSRIDVLIAAGAEAYQFTVAAQPAWAPGLGAVQSHVHAKAMSADGRICAVGSANMDSTGGYWETELLLIVEDAALAGIFEARIDALIAGSVGVDRDDPQWQALARGRQWMRHWPGVLSI